MNIRKKVPAGVHAEILAENFQGQALTVKLPAGSLSRGRKIDPGDLLFQILQVFVAVLFHGFEPIRGILIGKAVDDFLAQFGTLLDGFAVLEDGRRERQTGLFVALAAIGFVKQLKQFHKVVHACHFLPRCWVIDQIALYPPEIAE